MPGIDAAFIAQSLADATPYLGVPNGLLQVVIPAEVTRTGHAYNEREVGPSTTLSYSGMGGWFDENEQNPDSMGQVNVRSGGCTIFHRSLDTSYEAIVANIRKPGATLFWEGLPVELTSVTFDTWQKSTIVGFTLLRTRTAGP